MSSAAPCRLYMCGILKYHTQPDVSIHVSRPACCIISSMQCFLCACSYCRTWQNVPQPSIAIVSNLTSLPCLTRELAELRKMLMIMRLTSSALCGKEGRGPKSRPKSRPCSSERAAAKRGSKRKPPAKQPKKAAPRKKGRCTIHDYHDEVLRCSACYI